MDVLHVTSTSNRTNITASNQIRGGLVVEAKGQADIPILMCMYMTVWVLQETLRWARF